MKLTKLAPLALTCSLGAILMLPASAQPGGNGGGNNGGNGGNNGGGNRPDWQNMTPEQMAARRQEMREQSLRRMLAGAQFGTDVQDTVVAYANEQEKAREPLRQQLRKMGQAIDGGTTDAEFATLWNNFVNALDTEKTRTTTAQAALDEKIGYSKNPRLDAALSILGLVGDSNILTENPLMGGGRGGQGRGGQNGRGGNGRGGQGGGQGGPGGGQGGPGGGQGGPGGGQGGDQGGGPGGGDGPPPPPPADE